ncbi:MAG: diguanylate cyclase [Sphaerochaeta sp.]|nr:diguanylate cyclase [Sphaerochaeta sp.]
MNDKPIILPFLQRLLMVLLALVFILSLYFDSFLQTEPLDHEYTMELEQGWTIQLDSVELGSNLSLPYRTSEKLAGKTCVATVQLPDIFPNHNTCLSIDTSMTSLEVFVEGKNIYSFRGPEKGWNRPVFGGSFTHFIRLPDEFRGKELSLVYNFTSNNVFSGNIKAPLLGAKSSLILRKHEQWPSLVFGYTLMFVGIVSILISLVLKPNEEQKSLFYFGWVELAIGAWVFSQTTSKLLVIRNPALPMNLSFAALYLLPYFLSNYVCSSYRVGNGVKILKDFSLIFPFFYIVGGVLQYLGLVQYTDLLLISGLFLGVFLFVLLSVLVYAYIKGNTNLSSFLLAMGFLFVTILAEEVLLALNIKLKSAVLLHIGMSLSALVLCVHSIQLLHQKTEKLCKENLLVSMAYSDSLTAMGNRSAYDRRIDEVSNNPKKQMVLGVMVMDINNLKIINDTEGHKAGDAALRDFSKKIRKLLPDDAELFRIGGDEFVAFVPMIRVDQLEELTNSVVSFFSSPDKTPYSVAVGYDLFIPKKKEKFINIINRADSSMYSCKAQMKRSSIS